MRDEGFKEFVEDQLGKAGVAVKPMFGGYGIYQGSTFFGVVSESRLYFKTDDATRAGYTERGMKPFRVSKKQTLKTYYEVPADIIEDTEKLAAWARKAVACQPAK